MKQFETILFPQDMIHDIYKLYWNIIHKLTGVTWNMGPYKLGFQGLIIGAKYVD